MAINLQKIRADLNHGDPQIQTFALMSITRLSPQLVDSAEEIQAVYDKLQVLIKSENPDVVFLARKATNHIDSVFRPFFKDLSEKEGGPPGDPRTMSREELLRALDPELEHKYLASIVMRFVEIGQREDLSALQAFLGHEDDRVRSNLIEVYEAIGTAEHVQVLLPLLKDRSNRVRGNVILALVKLGHTDVRRNIEEMLCMGMISMRETAVYVLSQLKLPFVEELLIRASADPYDGVRIRATKALGNFITRRAIIRLKQLMNDIDINICEAAVESLRAIKRAHEELKRQRVVPDAQPARVAPPSPATQAAVARSGRGPVEPPVRGAEQGEQQQTAQSAEPRPAPPSAESPAAVPAAQPPPLIEPTDIEPAPTDSQPIDIPEEPPVPASPDSGTLQARQIELLREIGTEIYQLCRMNEITHEALDNVFYEILRYQDFLRAYLVKKQKGGTSDMNPRSAIEQLQAKIKDSFAGLGRCAIDLVDRGALKIPAEQAESMQAAMNELKAIDEAVAQQ